MDPASDSLDAREADGALAGALDDPQPVATHKTTRPNVPTRSRRIGMMLSSSTDAGWCPAF